MLLVAVELDVVLALLLVKTELLVANVDEEVGLLVSTEGVDEVKLPTSVEDVD